VVSTGIGRHQRIRSQRFCLTGRFRAARAPAPVWKNRGTSMSRATAGRPARRLPQTELDHQQPDVVVPTHEKATPTERDHDIHAACKTVDYTK
jgi:hypothetical protein